MNNSKKISVLLIDDDDSFRKVLTLEMEEMKFKAFSAATKNEALKILKNVTINVIILDIIMPDMNGLDFLQTLNSDFPETEVIMLTAHGSIDSAIQSIKQGAYDYLTKPCRLEELEMIVKKAYEKILLRSQNIMLKEQIQRNEKFPNIIGRSKAFQTVLEIVEKVAGTSSTVLLQGESGVGKEVIAQILHKKSLRNENPFVVVDCSTLHENLLESELFGHEKGAYTGAFSLKHGLFEIANGGTIFLDEIAEIDSPFQAKLLRALESGTFRRLGGTKDLKVDVRIIAASNQDLKKNVDKGLFREDLFYRLNVIVINIPPLRDRKEDIPLFINHFTNNSKTYGNSEKNISEEALRILKEYSWPGNVRELENIIERSLILSETDTITPKDLPRNLLTTIDNNEIFDNDQIHTLREIEIKYIKRILDYTGNNKLKAARLLGIDSKTLYRKIKSTNHKND
jgi:DNA-binding NtrC family response regulator